MNVIWKSNAAKFRDLEELTLIKLKGKKSPNIEWS